MTIQAEIQALESLAALDEELLQLEAELGTERAVIDDKRGQLQSLEGKLDAARVSIADMERTRNELITEARQMGLQLERAREKMGRSRTEREVNAAQREQEELRKLFRDREVEVQRLASIIEQARTDYSTAEGERSNVAFAIGDQEGASRQRLNKLEERLGTLQSRRAEVVVAVPPVLYRRYETIRKRRGSAICHTTRGTCSACNISLSPMLFQTLRRTPKFEQCPNCSRILYFRETPSEAPAQGESGS